MIFNGQGDDLQRIGGKPSVTWTLKLETQVTEGLLGTPPALARLCATVRAGGWVCGFCGRGGVRGGGEQYTRSVSGYNSCQRVSQRVNAAIPSLRSFFVHSPRPACSGSLIRTQGNDGVLAVQASAKILLSHSLRAPRRARSYNVTTFIVRAAPWRHARRHAAPAVPRPCAAQPEGFCNLGRSRKARGALP